MTVTGVVKSEVRLEPWPRHSGSDRPSLWWWRRADCTRTHRHHDIPDGAVGIDCAGGGVERGPALDRCRRCRSAGCRSRPPGNFRRACTRLLPGASLTTKKPSPWMAASSSAGAGLDGALGELPDGERFAGAEPDLGIAEAGAQRLRHQVAEVPPGLVLNPACSDWPGCCPPRRWRWNVALRRRKCCRKGCEH